MRDRGFITWLVLVVVLLALLNLPASISDRVKWSVREGVGPLQQVFTGISFRTREAISVFRGLGGLVRENRDMSAQLVRLQREVDELKALERENMELRRQLQFAEQSQAELVPCEVIGRDVSGWWQTIKLGSGSELGLQPGKAVVTTDGLVGKTVDVSARTSEVLLISDPSCKVSAVVPRVGAFGVVSGQGLSWRGRAGCRMDFINKDLPVRPGDEVLTSGLGGVYPAGLLIGYVEKVYMERGDLYQAADVVPKADLGRLSYVFIVGEDDDPLKNRDMAEDASSAGAAP